MKKLASLFGILCLACVSSAMGQNASELPASVSQENTVGDDFSGHYVYLSGGYSHIVSHVDASWTSGEPRLGFDWQVGYEWFFDKKMGVGFQYAGYISSGKINMIEVYKESIGIHYFAPQFAGRISLNSSRWRLSYSVGLGLVALVDRVKASKAYARNVDYGFGSNVSFGGEYKLTDKLSVTGNLSVLSAYIKQSFMGSPVNNKDEKTNGFERISINFGLRFRF